MQERVKGFVSRIFPVITPVVAINSSSVSEDSVIGTLIISITKATKTGKEAPEVEFDPF